MQAQVNSGLEKEINTVTDTYETDVKFKKRFS